MAEDVCVHEAAHCAMAVFLRRPVAYVWRETGFALPGETLGHARIPVELPIEPSQLPVCLVGYMAEGAPDWPPPYEEAQTEKLEALGEVIDILDLAEAGYDRAVELTREILADDDFKRLVDTIAHALRCCPRLDEQAVRELTEAASIPYPTPTGEHT